jgi:glycosyltransferase involved in cell wall biosynthesis
MKIAVNTRLLKKDHLTGIGVFTLETMKRLANMHPEHTFYFIFDEQPDPCFITSDNIIPYVVRFKSRHRAILLKFWFEYVLPSALRKIQPDLLISPDGFMSLSAEVPTLIVIHDINFEHYPEHLPAPISKFYRKYTPLYVHKASRVVTVSEFSKNDIISRYKISPEKVDVVYNGADVHFSHTDDLMKQTIRSQYTEGIPYFLFVGTIHPRKNLAVQLKAFELFRHDSANPEHKFLIVGEKWIWNDELDQVYRNMKYKKDVIFIGRLPFDELGNVYSASTALMYVSLFEGFGIPILEGFYSGTAVITSDRTSMPEVAGDAALCVDPDDYELIADSMKKIATDHEFRKVLIEKGDMRKKLFTWDRTAKLFSESLKKMEIQEVKKIDK